jgi:hypothetical protein
MTEPIREHMEVVGADGSHVGIVERLESDYIKLRKADAVQGSHRIVPAEWVERIDEKVHLDRSSEKALHDLDTHLGDAGSGAGPMGKIGIVGAGGTVVMTDDPQRTLKEKMR